MNAELAVDAADSRAFPTTDLPEVAVLGRSNVGKSTLLNQLVGRKGLARTSGTPGRTRRIFFYAVERRMYLVDLPGYGYAAASHAERRTFGPLVESYLVHARVPLRGALLLVDARRGAEREERELAAWLAHEGIATRGVLTKCDKLGKSALEGARAELARALGLPVQHCAAVSAKQASGLAPLARWLEEWTGVPFRRPDGAAF